MRLSMVLILLAVSQFSHAEDWAEKWFDNAVTSKPTHFKCKRQASTV